MTPRRRQYSLGAGALVQPLTESGEARLRDLDILRGRREASADRPDDLAIDHDWKRTLHFGESPGRETIANFSPLGQRAPPFVAPSP